jgi:GntR family transcriptional regulator/MocR family aminotransferase
MRDQLFHLSPDSGGSLQSQVREMMVRAILDGHIPAGGAVPSCRQLARQLGVARNTVVLAYQRLVDEGYLDSRERSGYYVNEDILGGRVVTAEEPESEDIFGPAWDSRLKSAPSRQRNIVKPDDFMVSSTWRCFPFPNGANAAAARSR